MTYRGGLSLLNDIQRILPVVDQASCEAEETKLIERQERIPGIPLAQPRSADPFSLVCSHLHCLKNAATSRQVQTSLA